MFDKGRAYEADGQKGAAADFQTMVVAIPPTLTTPSEPLGLSMNGVGIVWMIAVICCANIAKKHLHALPKVFTSSNVVC